MARTIDDCREEMCPRVADVENRYQEMINPANGCIPKLKSRMAKVLGGIAVLAAVVAIVTGLVLYIISNAHAAVEEAKIKADSAQKIATQATTSTALTARDMEHIKGQLKDLKSSIQDIQRLLAAWASNEIAKGNTDKEDK
jgi:hypothetical protein